MTRQVGVYAFDQDAIVTSTDGVVIAPTVDASTRLNGYLTQSSGTASTNSWKHTRFFSKGGTYKIRLVYLKNSNFGKANIGIDSNASSIVSALDQYNASLTRNNVYETTLEISRGYHDITFAVNGKNASSSNYGVTCTALEFDLIQEYPVYQDNNPANGSLTEGLVPLGVHVAQVAESTFTFNFADVNINKKYSKVIVIIHGESTAALELDAQINGQTGTNYFQQGTKSIGGTVSAVNLASQSVIQILPNTIITGDVSFRATLEIQEIVGLAYDGDCVGGTGSVGDQRTTWLLNLGITDTVTSITIKTSTSTWKANTKIEVYGVKKQ